MKDAFEVLQQKEFELARVQREIASLRIVAPLLSDDASGEELVSDGNSEEEGSSIPRSEATGTDGLFSSSPSARPRIWNVLKRGK